MDRGRENAVVTVICDKNYYESKNKLDAETNYKIVYKQPVYPDGIHKLKAMQDNLDDLHSRGINVVNSYIEGDKFIMPYIDKPVAMIKLKEIAKKDKNAFIQAMDTMYELILASSEHTDIISEKEKNLSRATEDYNLAVSRQDKIISDALDAYKEAENLVNKYNNASEEEKQSLDKEAIEYDYNLKKTAYNQAVNDKSSNLLMEKRALEDVKEASNTDELKKKLENLKKIEGAEGKFVSEKEGIVTNVAVVAGDVTSAGSAVYLADKESGYKFVAELSKDLKKYAKQGQSVVLKIGNSNNEIGDLTIDSISKGEDDNYKVSVLLPTGVGEIGDGGNLTLSSKSKKYQVCVPLEALHQEGQDKYYILVVGEEDTILGTEKVAVRVDVSIADKNDTYAALTEGTISNSQKIIVSSNKTIKEGDRVRLEEE